MAGVIAMVLDLVFVGVALGLRPVVQWRRTGDSGLRLGRPASFVEALARALLFASVALLVVGLFRSSGTNDPVLIVVATIVMVCSITLVVVAQMQMKSSWRVGVDHSERTDLVTAGLYARVRHPIDTGMVAFVVAQAVLMPSAWSLAAAMSMLVGVELQVRGVEEPLLERVHGDDFRRWAQRTGRFLPVAST